MTDGFCRLDDVAVVQASGTAARDFLSRQLTCDVANLTPEHPLFGAWLTPKGRALTLVHVLERGNGALRMLLPAELADGVMQRLTLFVMRDDVQLRRSDHEVVLGLSGNAISLAASATPDLASVPLSGAEGLALALCDQDQVGALTDRLVAAGCAELTPGDWDLLQIRAGLPRVVAATQEAFIPQMINLDLLQGISFSKGCYPGQEIVARTQHLGRIKRRAFIGHCDVDTPRAAPGDSLVSASGGDAVGRVVLSAVHDGRQEMLAVVALDATAGGDALHLGGPDGPPVRITPPAYF